MGLCNLDQFPRTTDQIDLYVFEEPVKVSLKTHTSFTMLARECSRIGIIPSSSKYDIWLSFTVQINLDSSVLTQVGT